MKINKLASPVTKRTLGCADDVEALLLKYVNAKDGNKPHLLYGVFSDHARLEMRVRTENIAFPSVVESAEAIIDVLVRQFATRYENVTTFYLRRPAGHVHANEFTCNWLVGMTDKTTGEGRVGTGAYHWRFSDRSPMQVTGLRIEIERMEIVPVKSVPCMLDWIANLPYPWCSASDILVRAPQLECLQWLPGKIEAESIAVTQGT